MATFAAQKAGFEKWRVGIDRAVGDARWNSWDCEIRRTTTEYNRHLAATAGYRPLDWLLVKAMAWVETGAESKEWKTNPMQIGNPLDPGLRSLLSGNEGGHLIVPPVWRNQLSISNAITVPANSFRAGVGYMLMRMANYAIRSIPDKSNVIHEVTVRTGDSIARLAKEKGSTVETMQKLNPDANVLKPGQVLRYQKASLEKVITGWKVITTSSIAAYYNVGDPMYARKLDYALGVIRRGKVTLCAQ